MTNSILQSMANGEAGRRYLDVHIPAAEVHNIVYGCVITRPSFGGNWCPGNATNIQPCNKQTCPGKKKC